MSYGRKICTSKAVVDNVGTLEQLEYTAAGDVIGIAKRL